MPVNELELFANCDSLVYQVYVAMKNCDVRMLNDTLESFSPEQVEFLEEIAKLAKNFHSK